MKLFGWLLAGAAAGRVLDRSKSTVNITLKIEQPDVGAGDIEDPDGRLYTSADGIYVQDNGVDPPRFFTKDGREVDMHGDPV